MQITIKLRLRDKHAAELNRQARAVNYVWNYCNEAQRHMLRWDRWLSCGDLAGLTAGAGRDLDIHSHTVQRICRQYVESRRRIKKPWLRFRGKKSLGWVPFNTGNVSFDGECFIFRSVRYEAMHLRDLLKPGIEICAGSFNQDARRRWYINVPIEIECVDHAPNTRVSIDFGLKDFATLSSGEKIATPHFYWRNESKLATHKASARLAKDYGLIVVGDVSPSKLAKIRMAKSVLDTRWEDFKRMLAYKSIRNGGSTIEVSEAYTTQACAQCGSIAGPKGQAGSNERIWRCDDCGSTHDRDLNAARNILRLGLQSLTGGAHV